MRGQRGDLAVLPLLGRGAARAVALPALAAVESVDVELVRTAVIVPYVGRDVGAGGHSGTPARPPAGQAPVQRLVQDLFALLLPLLLDLWT